MLAHGCELGATRYDRYLFAGAREPQRQKATNRPCSHDADPHVACFDVGFRAGDAKDAMESRAEYRLKSAAATLGDGTSRG